MTVGNFPSLVAPVAGAAGLLDVGFLEEVAELLLVALALVVDAAVANPGPGFFLLPRAPVVSFNGLPAVLAVVDDVSGGCGDRVGATPFERDSAKSGYLPFK